MAQEIIFDHILGNSKQGAQEPNSLREELQLPDFSRNRLRTFLKDCPTIRQTPRKSLDETRSATDLERLELCEKYVNDCKESFRKLSDGLNQNLASESLFKRLKDSCNISRDVEGVFFNTFSFCSSQYCDPTIRNAYEQALNSFDQLLKQHDNQISEIVKSCVRELGENSVEASRSADYHASMRRRREWVYKMSSGGLLAACEKMQSDLRQTCKISDQPWSEFVKLRDDLSVPQDSPALTPEITVFSVIKSCLIWFYQRLLGLFAEISQESGPHKEAVRKHCELYCDAYWISEALFSMEKDIRNHLIERKHSEVNDKYLRLVDPFFRPDMLPRLSTTFGSIYYSLLDKTKNFKYLKEDQAEDVIEVTRERTGDLLLHAAFLISELNRRHSLVNNPNQPQKLRVLVYSHGENLLARTLGLGCLTAAKDDEIGKHRYDLVLSRNLATARRVVDAIRGEIDCGHPYPAPFQSILDWVKGTTLSNDVWENLPNRQNFDIEVREFISK